MISEHSKAVAEKAERIYEERLRSNLEAKYLNQFAAVEPESGEYFIADSFSKAVAKARSTYPNRISFVFRVGQEAAVHIGGLAN